VFSTARKLRTWKTHGAIPSLKMRFSKMLPHLVYEDTAFLESNMLFCVYQITMDITKFFAWLLPLKKRGWAWQSHLNSRKFLTFLLIILKKQALIFKKTLFSRENSNAIAMGGWEVFLYQKIPLNFPFLKGEVGSKNFVVYKDQIIKKFSNLATKFLCGSLVLFLFLINPAFANDIVDDAGNKIKLTHPAQRVISLAPDLTEILFAIGAGTKIIGVVSGSDYPSAAKNIPVVASYNSIDIEKIRLLHPDFIVAWAETRYLTQLKKLKVPIYLSHQYKLMDVATTLQKLGSLLGTEKKANESAEKYLEQYQALKEKYANQKKLMVFYQVWPNPLMTITKNSWINEAISLCGGENIFANLYGVAPEVNVEAVIAANPDVIIGTDAANDGMRQWQAWHELNAIKNHNTYFIHADLIERAGPRILDGVLEVCQSLSLARKQVV
jgi:iron complex transport system substrate-binding protein